MSSILKLFKKQQTYCFYQVDSKFNDFLSLNVGRVINNIIDVKINEFF